MNSIATLSPQQLRRAADIQERIQTLQEELSKLLGTPVGGRGAGRKRNISAAGRARIAAATRARWARFRAEKARQARKAAS